MKHLIWLFIFYSSTCLPGISHDINDRPDQQYGYLYLFVPQNIDFTIEVITPFNLSKDEIEVDYFMSNNKELWLNEVYDERGYIVPVGEYSKIIITYPHKKESFKAKLEPAANQYNHFYFYSEL